MAKAILPEPSRALPTCARWRIVLFDDGPVRDTLRESVCSLEVVHWIEHDQAKREYGTFVEVESPLQELTDSIHSAIMGMATKRVINKDQTMVV